METAWQNATNALDQYGDALAVLNNSNFDYGINPEGTSSPEAEAILKKMQANSITAKNAGNRVVNGVNLNAENEKLAKQYEALTGRRLVYNNGWRFDSKNGALAYSLTSSSSGGGSSSNGGSNTSTTGGTAYQATVASYGNPPSGTLKQGDSGSGVKWLQAYLKKLGYFNYAVDGNFYTRTKSALQQFQSMAGLKPDGIYGSQTRAKLQKYHTGGVVTGGAGSLNDQEVLAILKKGELVLNDGQKTALRTVLTGLRTVASELSATSIRSQMQTAQQKAAPAGNTFAPNISVTVQSNGKMTDAEAKRCGKIISNTALDELKDAFTKRGI